MAVKPVVKEKSQEYHPPMLIRDALPKDAAKICAVLRLSIQTLCVADHNNNPTILEKWLGNKTPETLVAWICDPNSSMIVAEEGNEILAVGGLLHEGEISLNYVHPDARLKGISKKIVNELERRAKSIGIKRCTLNSTGTAKGFYLTLGYISGEPKEGFFGTTVYPMEKDL